MVFDKTEMNPIKYGAVYMWLLDVMFNEKKTFWRWKEMSSK